MEQWPINGKQFGRKQLWSNSRYVSIYPEDLRMIMKNTSTGSPSLQYATQSIVVVVAMFSTKG
jgi:hypothetical protein